MDVENAQTMKKSAGGSVLNEMKKSDVAGKGKMQSNLTKLLSRQHCLRLHTRPLVDSEGRL